MYSAFLLVGRGVHRKIKTLWECWLPLKIQSQGGTSTAGPGLSSFQGPFQTPALCAAPAAALEGRHFVPTHQ